MLQQQLQALHQQQLTAQQEYAAVHAAQAGQGRRSDHQRRTEESCKQYRAAAPALACRVLEQQAAPPAHSSCSVCQQTGCTVRCFTCHPAAECHVLLCDSCDTQRHAAAHLHDRQQYVAAGHWQDLPSADTAAGYFPFKPTSCTGCGQSGCFEAEPCALQPLDYITRDGIIEAKRAGFKCTSCSTVVWQQAEDFLRILAWPASLSSSHV
eukprot:jgi/Sobl393_1/1481/SZX65520.1